MQKVGLVVTLFIIITFLSLFVTKVMGLSLDGNVVFAHFFFLEKIKPVLKEKK